MELCKSEDKHWFLLGRRQIISNVLEKFFALSHGKTAATEAKKVIEIGCGSGGNLELLSKYGDLFAVEFDDEAREFATNRKVCEVKKGPFLPNGDLPYDFGFDLICLLDVLEHIDGDKKTIEKLSGSLNKKGKILVTVPAYQCLYDGSDRACHHKKRYTLTGLRKIFFDAGFRYMYGSYFVVPLFPVAAAVKLVHKFLIDRNSVYIKETNPIVNFICKKIFFSEIFFIPRISFPFGYEIVAIFEKN
ncbi:class I SAM-dependent methyltransferase [Candidatus Hydrogenosomobacter endosymbioticus]|uniref:Methyltransferase n=1 Tax=Candidatus Hydrogenosomobacter endosymbioticus TaxID=2558174 RepID=A0ABM7V9Y5_9PROT|nr:class I SAM-dependent methyltransferase [Candidatus Hydrogenosomobacter endosymbioticus]BDB96289.1 methyltransferase [Candidatus Hydrogenosomobacter endosymbioticus]